MVYFIATSPGVELSVTGDGITHLTCKHPCSAVTRFRKDEMRPYGVSDDVFQRGYAEEREYEAIPEIIDRRRRS